MPGMRRREFVALVGGAAASGRFRRAHNKLQFRYSDFYTAAHQTPTRPTGRRWRRSDRGLAIPASSRAETS